MRIERILVLTVVLCGVWACAPQGTEEKAMDAPSAGAWNMIETEGLPTARHEASAVAFEGKLYLMGGRRINPVEVYDPATKTWTRGNPTPLEIHHFQPAVWGGKVYVVAAMTGKYPEEQPLTNVWIYDPATDEWEEGPEIPEARRRGGAGAVVYNDKIYIAAGITFGHTSGTNGWFDEFDPATGEWRELPNAPHIRDHFPAVEHEGKMYLVGGRNTSYHEEDNFTAFFGAVETAVDVYDFAAGSWETLAAPLPVGTAAGGLAVLDGKLIYAGGETATDLAHSETQVLDLAAAAWSMGAPMQRGRHGTQAGVVDGVMYMATGSGGRGGGPELDSIEAYAVP